MTTYPNMGLAVPAQGGDSGTWDDKINACFALIDAHDHTSGKGVQIPVAGLNIDGDLSIHGHGLTSVGRIAFSQVATLATGARTLFVDINDNELYWRTNSGTNVKLTSGTTLNVSIVGGIAGDYASAGAEVAFDDTNKRYTFKGGQSPTKKWARLASGPVRIFEYDTSETVYVEHAVAAGIASSYTATWPAALPGAQTIVQIDASGNIVYSNTLVGAVIATDFLYTTEQEAVILGADFTDVSGSHTKFNSAAGAHVGWTLSATVNKLSVSLPVRVGDIITGYECYINKTTNAAVTLTARLYRTRGSTNPGTESTVSAGCTQSGNAPGFVTMNETGLSHTVAAGYQYYMLFTPSATNGGDVLYGGGVTIKRA